MAQSVPCHGRLLRMVVLELRREQYAALRVVLSLNAHTAVLARTTVQQQQHLTCPVRRCLQLNRLRLG